MAGFDNNELLYVAGIGLFVNILLFAATLLISLCKSQSSHNTTDVEALLHHDVYNNNDNDNDDNNDINVALLEDGQQQQQQQHGSSWSRLIDLIPTVKFSDVERDRGGGCSICLRDGFENEELCKILPGCDHVFHSECIDEWLKKRQSCPVCRKVFRIVNH